MIQSESMPTLCVGCAHFRKPYGEPKCAIAPWSDVGDRALEIREWLKRQTDTTSWEYMGKCPGLRSDDA